MQIRTRPKRTVIFDKIIGDERMPHLFLPYRLKKGRINVLMHRLLTEQQQLQRPLYSIAFEEPFSCRRKKKIYIWSLVQLVP